MSDLDYDNDLPPVAIEDRARAMGWKPLEEFRGDPRRWTDAETFIAKGEEELPILRDQTRRMSEKIARFENEVGTLRNTVAEQTDAVRNAIELARRADQKGYDRGIAELKKQQREAVSTGDMEAFDQLDEQIAAAAREREASEAIVTVRPATPPAAEPPSNQPSPETKAFLAANPWMSNKPILNRAMIDAHQGIISVEGQVSGAALADQYERAKAEVIEAFPQYFPEEGSAPPPPPARTDPMPSTPRARLRAPVLDPSQAQPPSRRGGSPFDVISDPQERAEARRAFESIKKWQPDLTEEEYVNLHANPHDDILSLQRQKRA